MDVNVYLVKVEVRFCVFGVVCGLIVSVFKYVLVEVGYWVLIIVFVVVFGFFLCELV